MKNLKLFLLILCINFSITSASALEGQIEFDSVYIDYSILKEKQYIINGDNYLKKAENTKISKTKIQQEFNYRQALGFYITATEINPETVVTYGKIGYIYHKLGEYTLARSNFDHGLNLQRNNPYVSYLYAGFYFDNQDFNKAIKYYKIAQKNNYPNKYSLYYNIGETNEKLGDLVRAKHFYSMAYALKPSDKLKAKMRSIDTLQYGKSQYYMRKKPYYYND